MSTTSFQWMTKTQALYIHDRSIHHQGGSDGIRDIGLLESALARPPMMFFYGERDLFRLAATYAVGIARNHPFIDGNKRTAYSVAGLFLYVHGYKLLVPHIEKQITTFENVSTGKISETELATFYKKYSIM